MAALTQDRNTPRRDGQLVALPQEANTRIYAGALVARNGNGRAVPAADTAGLVVIGRAEAQFNNTDGAAGALTVTAGRGVFAYSHSGLTQADIGKTVYAADDQTVTLTPGNRVVAGVLVDVDEDGAWVWLVPPQPVVGGAAQADVATADAGAASNPPTQAEVNAIKNLANETKAVLNGLLSKLRAAGLIAT